jgi:hypothetical protein
VIWENKIIFQTANLCCCSHVLSRFQLRMGCVAVNPPLFHSIRNGDVESLSAAPAGSLRVIFFRISAQSAGMLKPLTANSSMLAGSGKSRFSQCPENEHPVLKYCALSGVQAQGACGLMWRGRPRPRNQWPAPCEGSALLAVFTSTCR